MFKIPSSNSRRDHGNCGMFPSLDDGILGMGPWRPPPDRSKRLVSGSLCILAFFPTHHPRDCRVDWVGLAPLPDEERLASLPDEEHHPSPSE